MLSQVAKQDSNPNSNKKINFPAGGSWVWKGLVKKLWNNYCAKNLYYFDCGGSLHSESGRFRLIFILVGFCYLEVFRKIKISFYSKEGLLLKEINTLFWDDGGFPAQWNNLKFVDENFFVL